MPKIPEEIGKYKILSCLGTGGTSIVYTATHPTLKRKVVLKKLNLRGKKQHYERFRQEAALMMDLNHDSIVRVFDHFKEGSRHYIVMEFVEGCSLDEIIKKSGALPPGACRLILDSCCRAIEYIHSRDIIHRDIKPSNIFISRSGEIKLGDFGIALMESESEGSGDSLPIGTPSYMAPEQFLPHKKVTKRTDLYALGASLYELLTAEKLFEGSTLEELKKNILKSWHHSLLPLLFSKGIPLYWIIRKSIFRNPAFRFASVKPVKRILKFVHPKIRNHEAQSVLQFLVESTAGEQKTGKQKSMPLPAQPKVRKTSRRGRTFWGILVFLLISGSFLFYSFASGNFYRLFFKNSKGAVRIRVLSESASFPYSGDLHLYRDKFRYLESIDEVDLSGGESLTDIYYLNTGNYRILVRWGSQVEWILFYLPPLAKQKDVMIVEVQKEDVPTKPVQIQSTITDGLTGRNLSDESIVFVQRGDDKWLPLDELLLMTGEAYRLKVEHEGYYTRYLNVPLQFYQDLLEIRIQLIPLPGVLSVEHDLEKLSLSVNGRKVIAGGGEDKAFVKLGSLSPGSHEWRLSPGQYHLRFTSGGAEQEVTLDVDSLGEYRYTLQVLDNKLVLIPR